MACWTCPGNSGACAHRHGHALRGKSGRLILINSQPSPSGDPSVHALRLGHQGLEIVRDGRLTLPMAEHERERVLRVKRGDVAALDDVVREISEV
jgi:hypothetical protein